MTSRENWFEKWFDTPYYGLLYSHRGEEEAEAFIAMLCGTLSVQAGQSALDMPCGWGRHAVSLAKQGLQVVGLDINPQLIARAKAAYQDHPSVRFAMHDMRVPYTQQVDYVFNLFTSLGYFDTLEENATAIAAMAQSIVPGGYFVLDYFNAAQVIDNLVPVEHKTIEGVHFTIKKSIQQRQVIKDIYIEDEGQAYQYQERVWLLDEADFAAFFDANGLALVQRYGSYGLAPWDRAAMRYICVAQRR